MNTGFKIVLAGVAFLLINASVAGIPAQDVQVGSKSESAKDVALDKVVRKQFTSAPIAEVLDWLRSEGFSFVSKDEIGTGKLTLNIEDKPLRDAANAIADVMGGHWERHGNVYAYKDGPAGFGNLFMSDAKIPGVNLDGGQMKFLPKEFTFDKDSLKGLDELKGSPMPFQFDGQKWKEIPDGKAYTWTMDPKSAKEFEDSMKDLKIKLKDLPKGQDFAWSMEPEDSKKFGDSMKKFRLDMKGLPKGNFMPLKGFSLGGQDLTGLLKSLSPEQKAKQKRQGYLKVTDLSAAQRKMLGITGQGKFSISVSIDGQKLNVRND